MKNLLVILINFVYGFIPYGDTVFSLFGGIQKNAKIYSLISIFTYAKESSSVIDVITITKGSSFSLFAIFVWADGVHTSFFSFCMMGDHLGVILFSVFTLGNKIEVGLMSVFAVASELKVYGLSCFSYTGNTKEDVSIGLGLLNFCKDGLVR